MRSLPEIFFFAIVFYVLYRFIFNFVVPIARTTRQVRQQFRNMQEQQTGQGYQGGPQANADANTQPTGEGGRKPNTDKVGEYIDFEEVK
jgi:hypothetical protein